MKVGKHKKILFITPGAESFGGNIFLLNFLRWFKEISRIPFVTLYGDGGESARKSQYCDFRAQCFGDN
ncbi:hypothetical protein BH20ACI4_BH20ACI4_33300 [soil metagenome]